MPAPPEDRQSSRSEFWAGAGNVIPLAVGVAIYGLAFGLLAAQAGMSELQVGTMGALVPLDWLAAAVTLGVAVLTRNLPLTMATGIVTIWLYRQYGQPLGLGA